MVIQDYNSNSRTIEQTQLTKQYIDEVKIDNVAFDKLVQLNSHNMGNLIFILENLGHLPKSFDGSLLLKLTNSKFSKVRELSIKNIAKLTQDDFLLRLKQIGKTDSDTAVRREAVSAIGRMRNPNNKEILIGFLQDIDPKIVCQAIRGLLVFKGDVYIDNTLQDLIEHENETVRAIIGKEYYSSGQSKKNTLSHTETYDFLTNTIVNGDVCEVLRLIPEESIHLTFTSPPYYNARDYSIYPSYEAYLKFLEEVFLQTYRVTKEGRFLIVNTSPIIVPRISRAHSSKRYPIPFDIHYFLVKMGWEFIDDIVWQKPEYSVKNRVGGFHQHRKPLAYKPNNVTEYLMVYRKQTSKLLDWNIHQYDHQIVDDSKIKGDFETTNVWKIDPKSDKVHSAVFPAELCQRVIQYYSFKGDLVFDPFAGSGTLGRVARNLGRKFFLTEKEFKYFEYMKTFFKKESLFAASATNFLTIEQFKEQIKQ
jgi:DNA modification methylase